MTECQEIAATMLKAYLHWIETTPRGNCVAAAREYVRQQANEGMTWTDNVAYELFRAACPHVNKPDEVDASLTTFKNLRIRPDGEANYYGLIDGEKWVAVVHLNGEFMTARQEAIMARILAALKSD